MPGLVLGALGGGLGDHFGSQGCLGQQKKPGGQNVYASGLTFGAPFSGFSVIVRCFRCAFFSSLHFGGYQDRFLMDFDKFWGLF